MKQRWLEQCENTEYSVVLALTADGELMLSCAGGAWENVEFCRKYAGYYASCRFTAVAAGNGQFYAGGTDADGAPHLFTSLMGGVWEETQLIDVTAGGRRAGGKILRILYEEAENQIYLICENGELVTVPDCPRCIRICRVTEETVLDGKLDGHDIVLECRNGSEVRVPCAAARQYRASMEYVTAAFRRSGGYLADLRTDAELPESEIAGSGGIYVKLRYSELRDWLTEIPKTAVIAFLCESGVLADEAAVYSRKEGWKRAYSLGGKRTET